MIYLLTAFVVSAILLNALYHGFLKSLESDEFSEGFFYSVVITCLTGILMLLMHKILRS